VPVLRLIGFLAMTAIGLSGFLTVDYSMSRKQAQSGGGADLTIQDYLGGLSGRIASITGPSGTPGLPRALADMMPEPPAGWTVRPTAAEDVEVFQPRNRREGDPEARKLVTSVGSANVQGGAEAVVLTFDKGDQRVVIKAVRYPDAIFRTADFLRQRQDLQSRSPVFRGLSFMTVRGLDVTEDVLPDGMRGRLFIADVGGQIHLSVLAPKRMKDAELVAFFQTLHVKAMNASVVEKQAGLGDVPVIVLASALGKAEYEAYQADRAARATEIAARRTEALAAAEAQAKATEGASTTRLRVGECEKGAGGVKRCTVGD
jgi:hypothetical protein